MSHGFDRQQRQPCIKIEQMRFIPLECFRKIPRVEAQSVPIRKYKKLFKDKFVDCPLGPALVSHHSIPAPRIGIVHMTWDMLDHAA